MTFDGRTGTAFGRDEANRQGQHTKIIVDPDTGEYIGSRTLAGNGMRGLPVGTVFQSTAVTTSVVDGVPAG